jgi:hypothetical protein
MYTDIVDFDRQASHPTTTSLLALEVLTSEIRSIMVRKSDEAEEIGAKVDERWYIWRGIVEGFSDAVESLESADGQEVAGNGDYDG